MDATNDQIKNEFRRHVKLCSGIGMNEMIKIINEGFVNSTSPSDKIERVESRPLIVKLSLNKHTNSFFVDFWSNNEIDGKEKYIVSIKIGEQVAIGISRDTGIRILY